MTRPIHLAVFGVALWVLVFVAIIVLSALRLSGAFVVHLHWLAVPVGVGAAAVIALGACLVFGPRNLP